MKYIALTLLLALAGCGSFPLGTSYPANGQTLTQTQADTLVCQDQAKREANTPERVAASAAAGVTIVGAPVAMAEERRKQREVFAECMTTKGYRVVAPA